MNTQAPRSKPDEMQHSIAGISLLQEVYVIAIVFAFHKLSDALYAYFVQIVTWWPLGAPVHPLLLEVTFPALAIITFGLRFFWCVDLLKQCIDNGLRGSIKLGISVAVLLLQAFIVYFLAALLAGFVDSHKNEQALVGDDKKVGLLFFGFATALAVVNTAWLVFIRWNHCREDGDASLERTVSNWIYNNVFFTCVGLAFLAIAWFEGNLGHDGCLLAWSGAIFILNSLIDFWLNWRYYFLQKLAKAT